MPPQYKFRRHSRIGYIAAENDGQYLDHCFIDKGELDAIGDCVNPKSIVLGRTGSGKSALLLRLEKSPNVRMLNPEDFSMQFLSDSRLLHNLGQVGVNFDLFYKYLWRHVFVREFIRMRYHIENETDSQSFFARLWERVGRNTTKSKALEYLRVWGGKFWVDTHTSLLELTEKIESSIAQKLGAKIGLLDLSAEDIDKLTTEQKSQVWLLGQEVVNHSQLAELSKVLDFMNDELFSDPHHSAIICLDKLDEPWVRDSVKYPLLRSLIETVRDFRKVQNTKIVIAMRIDLLERVFRITRDSGFQEEKYRDYFLPITWNASQLMDLLDKRIDYLVRQSYTSQKVSHRDLLAFKIQKQPAIEYMLARTMNRPRELIEFFNNCIERCDDKPTITKNVLSDAETTYSKNRFRSLQDEWFGDYPYLLDLASPLLSKMPASFYAQELNSSRLESIVIDYIAQHEGSGDMLTHMLIRYYETKLPVDELLAEILRVFYDVGLVGIKTTSFDSVHWSYTDSTPLSTTSIGSRSKVSIHPTFFRVLGTQPHEVSVP